MSSSLKDENRNLRRQLKAFLSQARQNEAKLQRFNEQELRLISATSVPELIELVLARYPQTFQLDSISLLLIDPEYELARMLEESGMSPRQIPGLLLEPERKRLPDGVSQQLSPYIGPYIDSEHDALFPHRTQALRSCARLPLIRRGELIGSLNMGSGSSERFVHGSATDFLERLAAIVAICLENCTNRQRLHKVGLTDPLTHVNNRRYFDQRLLEETQQSIRKNSPLGCMFLDVDHFKRINDGYGHQVGDTVLRELAMLFSTQLRQPDVLCRYGGEEFVVLLPQTELDTCCEIAERLRHSVEEYSFSIAEHAPLRLTVSIGVSCLNPADHSPCDDLSTRLVTAADHAVYQAKGAGRNCIEVHTLQAQDRLSPTG